MNAIRNYNWKWLLESFYGAGVAIALAVALIVYENNPFDESPDNFDTLSEWKNWFLIVSGASYRAAWVALSSFTAALLAALIKGLGGTADDSDTE